MIQLPQHYKKPSGGIMGTGSQLLKKERFERLREDGARIVAYLAAGA